LNNAVLILSYLEVGFGTGLNALLTAVKAANRRKEVFYTSIEKFPLDKQMTELLNHPHFAGENGKEVFDRIHSAEWGVMCSISSCFSILKIKGDLTQTGLQASTILSILMHSVLTSSRRCGPGK